MDTRDRLRLTFALVALSFGATTARAETSHQEREGVALRAMSLEGALEHARANHARIAAARLRFAAARGEVDVADAQWLPRIGAFAQVVGGTSNNSTATQIAATTVDIPRVGGTPIGDSPSFRPYPTTMVALGARQQLFDFGRIAAENAAASLLSAVERSRAVGTTLEVGFGVEQAYYAVLAAHAVEAASQGAFVRAVAHRDYAQANVKSGMRPPIELTRAEADVARYEAAFTRAGGAIHVARAVFAAAVAVDDIELEAAGNLAHGIEPLPPLADALRHAELSPLVVEARARSRAQRGETERISAQARPTLYATGSVNGRAGGSPPNAGAVPAGDGWVPLVPNYDVGVVLSWPMFEPTWNRRADVSRERERASEAETSALLRDQRAAISGAWHEAEVAELMLTALERGAEAARANYEQAEQRFKVGVGTSTELADAEALRTEADIQLAVGHFQKARARVAFTRSTAEIR